MCLMNSGKPGPVVLTSQLETCSQGGPNKWGGTYLLGEEEKGDMDVHLHPNGGSNPLASLRNESSVTP